jgi:transcriptional regulator with XRE-family HTH domain
MPRKRKEHPDRWNDPFPTRLRQLLDENDLSHQVFGEYLGVARQSVGNYCDGSVSPSIDTLLKVSDYFSVSVDYLLGRTDVRTLEPDVQMASQLTGLTEEAINVLRHICSRTLREGTLKTLNELLTHPDFMAVTDYWEYAWHCATEYLRFDRNMVCPKQEEMDALTNAMKLVRNYGMDVRGWDESAHDDMSRSGLLVKQMLESIADNWCHGDEYDSEDPAETIDEVVYGE